MPSAVILKKRIYNSALALISCVLFFAACEAACRFLQLTDKIDSDFKFYIRYVDNDLRQYDFIKEDPLLMWSLKPLYDDGAIKVNSHGLRDKEYSIKKKKGVFRILCLGDSTTFGLFTPLEKCYHSLLEERLNFERAHGARVFEVINAGIPGYTSAQGVAFYNYVGRQYEPDIVLFFFGVNESICRFHLSDKQIMQNELPFF